MTTKLPISLITMAVVLMAIHMLPARTGRESTAGLLDQQPQAASTSGSTKSPDSATAVHASAQPGIDRVKGLQRQGAANSIDDQNGPLLSKPNETGTINLAIEGASGRSAFTTSNARGAKSQSVNTDATAGQPQTFGLDPNPPHEYGPGPDPNESQVFGLTPGENESQNFGPGPGDNDPQVQLFGPGPGENELQVFGLGPDPNSDTPENY